MRDNPLGQDGFILRYLPELEQIDGIAAHAAIDKASVASALAGRQTPSPASLDRESEGIGSI